MWQCHYVSQWCHSITVSQCHSVIMCHYGVIVLLCFIVVSVTLSLCFILVSQCHYGVTVSLWCHSVIMFYMPLWSHSVIMFHSGVTVTVSLCFRVVSQCNTYKSSSKYHRLSLWRVLTAFHHCSCFGFGNGLALCTEKSCKKKENGCTDDSGQRRKVGESWAEDFDCNSGGWVTNTI